VPPGTARKTGDPAAAKRSNPVAVAQRSDRALTKAARKRTHGDYPVHSFTSLLADLATICANRIQPTNDTLTFTIITIPTGVPPTFRTADQIGSDPERKNGIGEEIPKILS
jgi:hypothetical protein